MILRNRLKASTITGIGLVCFVVANLATLFLHPSGALAGDLIHAAEGFLYGISITFMLCGLWLNRRRGSRNSAEKPTA